MSKEAGYGTSREDIACVRAVLRFIPSLVFFGVGVEAPRTHDGAMFACECVCERRMSCVVSPTSDTRRCDFDRICQRPQGLTLIAFCDCFRCAPRMYVCVCVFCAI